MLELVNFVKISRFRCFVGCQDAGTVPLSALNPPCAKLASSGENQFMPSGCVCAKATENEPAGCLGSESPGVADLRVNGSISQIIRAAIPIITLFSMPFHGIPKVYSDIPMVRVGMT